MSELDGLFIPEKAHNRVPGGPDPVWRPASRRDRRLADGWETCDECGGSGGIDHGGGVAPWDGPMDIEQCLSCVDGLVPNRPQIEAAAEANWYEWHKGHPGGFKGAMRDMAEAALLAAGRTP